MDQRHNDKNMKSPMKSHELIGRIHMNKNCPMALLSFLLLLSCSEDSRPALSSGQLAFSATPDVAAQINNVSAALPVTGQSATLDIIGVRTDIPMTTNPDGTVTATVSIPPGPQRFQINYRAGNVQIFRATGEATVLEQQATTVALHATTDDFDDDGDGAKNLTEVRVGSDPRSASSRPVVFKAMEARGGSHTCGVVDDGSVRCWGRNDSGQLGNGTITDTESPTPVEVVGISNAASVATAFSHSCARLEDGTVKCWGNNSGGQLGDGTTDNRLTPVTVVGINNAVSLTASFFHTCARRSTGTISCWGANSNGQLGDGTTVDRLTPVQVSGISNATAVSAGASHTCAELTGKIQCWGSNLNGELGNNTTASSSTPQDVQFSVFRESTSAGVAASGRSTCSLQIDRTVTCWGSNSDGQLGDGSRSPRLLPGDKISDVSTAILIAASSVQACAMLVDKTALCWGRNDDGQLGDGSKTDRLSPVPVAGITSAASVTVGNFHGCALLTDGTIRCWGKNDKGQLGDGTTTNSTVPITVKALQ